MFISWGWGGGILEHLWLLSTALLVSAAVSDKTSCSNLKLYLLLISEDVMWKKVVYHNSGAVCRYILLSSLVDIGKNAVLWSSVVLCGTYLKYGSKIVCVCNITITVDTFSVIIWHSLRGALVSQKTLFLNCKLCSFCPDDVCIVLHCQEALAVGCTSWLASRWHW